MSYRQSFSHVSFRDMMHRARKEAILEECTRLLSERGYDAMTLDQVAEAAGSQGRAVQTFQRQGRPVL